MSKLTLRSSLGRQGLKLVLAAALLLTGQAGMAQNVPHDTLLLDPMGDGGFENGADFASNGWTVENYTSNNTNKWFVGTASNPTNGMNAAYISNDAAGATNNYSITASSRVMFWRDITFPAGYSTVELTFKIKVQGEKVGTDYYDDLSVHFQSGNAVPSITQPGLPSASAPQATITNANRRGTLVSQGVNYVTKTYSLSAGNTTAATTRRLIFYWRNDNVGGTQPPASIDEIAVVAYSDGPFPNDDADSAALLTLGAGCTGITYSNYGATFSTGEPTASCRSSWAGPFRPVWFKFVAPLSGMVRISTDNGGTLAGSGTRTGVFSVTDSSNYNTFNIIHCAGNSGVTNGSTNILYPAGLTPGETYYIALDVYYASTQGTFCIAVDELDNTMISTTAADCAAGKSISDWTGTNDDYHGWMSLVSNDGNLIANIRQNAGDNNDFTSSVTIKTGTPRVDVNSRPYLNRNYFINGTDGTATTDADVRFFFSNNELTNLGVALGNLNVSRVSGSTCTSDFTNGATLLTQDTSASANGVSWIQVNTPGFSNFFIHEGTTPLPVELISFGGRSEKDSNLLEWKMADEKGISHFELQRSLDGIRFITLGNIKTNGSNNYKFADVNPDNNGKNHYRLAIKKSDRTSLSEIVSIYSSKGFAVALNVYPNPVSAILQVNIGGNIAPEAQIELTDLTGRIVLKQGVNSSSFQINMNDFASGTYLLRYTDSKNQSVIKLSKN